MSEKKVINFYSTEDAYGCFSNFAAAPFKIGGKIWKTSEHYFQAQKFAGTEHEEELRLVDSPMVVARMGRSRQRPLRRDWETVRDDVMREALRAKFAQHEDLKKILLETGDAVFDAMGPAYYDAAMDAGVRRLQSAHGLVPDGIVGPETLLALDARDDEGPRLRRSLP